MMAATFRVVECYQGHVIYTQPKQHATLADAAACARAQQASGRLHRDLAIMQGAQFVPSKEWRQ